MAKLTGFDVEIIEKLRKKLGWKVNLKRNRLGWRSYAGLNENVLMLLLTKPIQAQNV